MISRAKFAIANLTFVLMIAFNVRYVVHSEDKAKDLPSQSKQNLDQVTKDKKLAKLEISNECQTIGIVPIQLPVSDIGGCFLWLSDDNSWSPGDMSLAVLTDRQTLFITSIDFKQAMINLSGSNQILNLLKEQGVPKREKKGDSFRRTYIGNKVKATIECKVIDAGEIDWLGCRYTMYEATLTLTVDKTTCKLVLRGQCGC